jgi:hypothetical protein
MVDVRHVMGHGPSQPFHKQRAETGFRGNGPQQMGEPGSIPLVTLPSFICVPQKALRRHRISKAQNPETQKGYRRGSHAGPDALNTHQYCPASSRLYYALPWPLPTTYGLVRSTVSTRRSEPWE